LVGSSLVRALILSDLHGHREAFLKAASEAKRLKVELVVVCGDITNFGHVEQAAALLEQLTSLNLPLLYVPGNCDLSSFLEEKIENAQNLHASCVKIKDVAFIGVGGAPSSYLRTPLEFPENWLMDSLNRGFGMCSSEKKLIVLSHTPPFDTKVDLAYMNRHIGSRSVRRFVEEKKPLAVFCGHVHEAQGIDRIGETLVVNPRPAKKGKYALAEINDTVEVTFGTF
jgi:Icc-related predicted phosphoesterase